MIEELEELQNSVKKLMEAQEKHMLAFSDQLPKIDDEDKRNYLKDAMKNAQNGNLNIDNFLNVISKWQ